MAQWEQRWRELARAAIAGPFPELGRLSARQGLVFTAGQAVALGVKPGVQQRRLSNGTWSRPRRGVLSIVAADRDTGPALHAAAAALAFPGRVVAGRSAAALRGLPMLSPPKRPELLGPHALTRPNVVISVAALPDSDVQRWAGVLTTTLARTVVDLARVDRRQGLVAADAALYQRRATAAELAAVLTASAGRRGVARAQGVLALATPKAESPLESLTRLVLHDAGLPTPQLQVVIEAEDFHARVDLLFEDYGVVVEADGRVKYQSDELWAEKLRQERLEQLGYRVVRVTWEEVTRYPHRTADRVRDALHRGTPVATRNVAYL